MVRYIKHILKKDFNKKLYAKIRKKNYTFWLKTILFLFIHSKSK
jgi:hypothetical protein